MPKGYPSAPPSPSLLRSRYQFSVPVHRKLAYWAYPFDTEYYPLRVMPRTNRSFGYTPAFEDCDAAADIFAIAEAARDFSGEVVARTAWAYDRVPMCAALGEGFSLEEQEDTGLAVLVFGLHTYRRWIEASLIDWIHLIAIYFFLYLVVVIVSKSHERAENSLDLAAVVAGNIGLVCHSARLHRSPRSSWPLVPLHRILPEILLTSSGISGLPQVPLSPPPIVLQLGK